MIMWSRWSFLKRSASVEILRLRDLTVDFHCSSPATKSLSISSSLQQTKAEKRKMVSFYCFGVVGCLFFLILELDIQQVFVGFVNSFKINIVDDLHEEHGFSCFRLANYRLKIVNRNCNRCWKKDGAWSKDGMLFIRSFCLRILIR